MTSIEIFRQISRWRCYISNQFLISTRINLDESNKKNYAILKKIKFISNPNSIKNENNPNIIILRSNFHNLILEIITEGLASYGYNVTRANYYQSSKSHYSLSENVLNNDLSLLLNRLYEKKKIETQKYVLVIFSKSDLNYNPFLFDKNNIKIILINPNFKKTQLNNLYTILKNNDKNKSKLLILFSKFSLFILPNLRLRKFKRDFVKKNDFYEINNFRIIKNARYSFKYYETILIGNIIQIIEKAKKKPLD
ncbi:MAG: hypothetical protein JXA99_06630 [Candidatus Lokiarchaeota archaeon]|nr:hypothetical protein [Candidatus Lokiarchaeota archaeon]